MRIAILGATGPTGRHVVDQALSAGHDVITLVREPARLHRTDPRLHVVTGDATRTDDLKLALTGADAVVSALGSGNDRKSDIAGRAAAALVPAAQAAGVHRAVVLSAFGVGDTRRLAGPFQRLIIAAMMDTLFADKAHADDMIRRSPLDWTLVYPVTLTNGPMTGTYTAGEAPKISMTSRISRADVAHFMVGEITAPKWSRRTAILTA